MCGRYTLKRTDVIARYGHEILKELDLRELSARYNAAPSQLLFTVTADGSGKPSAAPMKWGFVPFWDKSEKPKIAPINAKSEEVFAKRVFAASLQKRRCLVPADGFFEWRKLEGNLKEPHHIQLTGGQPFFFAGIYEHGAPEKPGTFAILTTAANSLVERLHNRMPVILRGEAALAWLEFGPITEDELVRLAVPYAAVEMESWPVRRLVGNAKNDGPELVEPVVAGELRAEKATGEQLSLF